MTKRRAYGTGSLRHISGNRYRFQIRAHGRTLSRTFSARNATDANKQAGAIRTELLEAFKKRQQADGAERATRQAWTVKQYAACYMREWAPLHLADTTRERRRGILDNQVVPMIGHKLMREVTPDDLARMYAKLGETKTKKRNGAETEKVCLSGSTIATIHTAVRALFSFAYEIKRDIPENPAARRAARPRVTVAPKRQTALSVEHIEGVLAAVADEAPRIAPAVTLAAYLGTRRGETVALQWRDVDFTGKTITVRRSISWTPSAGMRVKGTKTEKERIIPLDEHTLAELTRIRAEQRRERLRFGQGWRGADTNAEDYIAAERDGAPMNPAALGVTLGRVCKERKFEPVTMQQLRHSWVSMQIANGYDAVTIAAMSGHSPAVLYQTYAHAFDARKRESMDRLGEARKAARVAARGV